MLPELSPFDPLSEPDETACCIAAPPEDGLARLRRLIDEEVSMARAYRCHARSAPPAARRVLLRMAEDTEDVCLRELFQRLSRAEYGHAAMLLHLLENCLTSGNNLLK